MKKYGRTYHLPQSPGAGSDDKILHDLAVLRSAQDLVITEKMDGENTTIFAGGCYPRSPDARPHPSRDWMKAFAAAISPALSDKERIVGEYLYARHAITYADLPSYFLGFAWIQGDVICSWDETAARFQELGIEPVPLIHRGAWRESLLEEILAEMDFSQQEGFVLRSAERFTESEMSSHMAKYVRADHVRSETHWMQAPLVRNRLR